MNALFVLGAAGIATWLLRITFIDLFPARRLPPRVRELLEAAAPAAIAALVTTELVHRGAHDRATIGALVAGTLVAALVTARYGNLALTAALGIATYAAVGAL